MDSRVLACCEDSVVKLCFVVLGGRLVVPLQTREFAAAFWQTHSLFGTKCGRGATIPEDDALFDLLDDIDSAAALCDSESQLNDVFTTSTTKLFAYAMQFGVELAPSPQRVEVVNEPVRTPNGTFRFVSPVLDVSMGSFGAWSRSVHQASCLLYRLAGFVDVEFDDESQLYRHPTPCSQLCCADALSWRSSKL